MFETKRIRLYIYILYILISAINNNVIINEMVFVWKTERLDLLLLFYIIEEVKI